MMAPFYASIDSRCGTAQPEVTAATSRAGREWVLRPKASKDVLDPNFVNFWLNTVKDPLGQRHPTTPRGR